MNYKEFQILAKENKTVPVYKRILADLLTPISAYMRLGNNSNYAFILESVEKGTRYGRYSFIGRNPQMIVRAQNKITQVFENGIWRDESSDFLEYLRKIQKNIRPPSYQAFPISLVAWLDIWGTRVLSG